MDLGDLERDEKLYRTSPELLLDFKRSLGPFLWATSKSGKQQLRRRVRVKDTDRLVGLVESLFLSHRLEAHG
jgi:tubulin-specific chaperone D